MNARTSCLGDFARYTSLNVVGDSCTCLYVAKSENLLNEEVYNANLHELAAPATAETA